MKRLGRRTALSLLALPLALSWISALPLSAQRLPIDTVQAYRSQLEVQLLLPLSIHMLDAPPGVRLTFQRRIEPHVAGTISAFRLADPLTRLTGAAAGASRTVRSGPVVVEAFVEVGGGALDDRIDSLGYSALDDAGRPVYVPVYREATVGWVWGGGAGLSASTVLGRKLAVRTAAGYWRFRRGDAGLDGLHLMGSLGLARRSGRWYRHRSDREPPTLVVLEGGRPVRGDTVIAVDGAVEVVAADRNGIASVWVNGDSLVLVPATPDQVGVVASAGAAPGAAVVGRYGVAAAATGTPLTVAVRDSAGLLRLLDLVALPPGDDRGPEVRLLSGGAVTGIPWAEVRGIAHDPSGVADAHLNDCPLTITPSPTGTARALGLTGPAWLLSGGAPASSATATLSVRDRAGNRTALDVPLPAPAASAGVEPVVWDQSAVVASVGTSGKQSVRVTLRAHHPAGIAAVRVGGAAAPLHAAAVGPVAVHGWVVTDPGAALISVEVVAADGVVAALQVPIRETSAVAEAQEGPWGRLHVLQLGGPAPLAIPLEGARLVRPESNTLAGALRALRRLREGLRERDRVLVRVEGGLAAAGEGAGVALPDGVLPLDSIAAVLRESGDGVSIVSAGLRPSRSWNAEVDAPGAAVSPGCRDPRPVPSSGVVQLGDSPLERIVAGLSGEADLDGDGLIRAAELVRYLGGAEPSGWLPYDPLEPLATTEGRIR